MFFLSLLDQAQNEVCKQQEDACEGNESRHVIPEPPDLIAKLRQLLCTDYDTRVLHTVCVCVCVCV